MPFQEIERAHYLTHNNDIHDPRYQTYARPIVDYILSSFTSSQQGLDFGCGTGLVMAHLLEPKGFPVNSYDPFFYPNPEALNKSYDYIIISEVIEHFHRPATELTNLKKMLKPKGQLIIRTEIYRPEIDFAKWFYHQDITHVGFYSLKTIQWIATNYCFESWSQQEKLIILK
jgi:2-polyprenyl-3-methyl-5-hydroxy-6-metoxy-1,4-benzoquinol methylase